MLRFGYNSNGFAHHKLEDCVEILAELGYRGIAITVDVHHLNPETTTPDQILDLRRLLEQRGLEPSIETGSRYLLDARRKHQPTLLDPDPTARRIRFDYLRDCVTIAGELGAKVVSFWSGALPTGANSQEANKRLAEGVRGLLDFAKTQGVRLGFEPEPGMFIESIGQFRSLRDSVGQDLQLSLDIGHCYCTQDLPISKVTEEFRSQIATAAIEDIRGGKHEHLMFGEGEIDFAPVLKAFESVQYSGLIHVELSRDSYRAPQVAAKAIEFLQQVKTA